MVCVLVLGNFYGWFVVAGTTSFPALSAALMCFKCLSNGLCLDCTMNLKIAKVLFFLMHFQQFCSPIMQIMQIMQINSRLIALYSDRMLLCVATRQGGKLVTHIWRVWEKGVRHMYRSPAKKALYKSAKALGGHSFKCSCIYPQE